MAQGVIDVRWSANAMRDLHTIGAHIAEHNPTAAQSVVQTIYEGCLALGDFPYRGRKSRMDGRHDLVFSPLPYIAVYRVLNSQVQILRVYHMARHWP